MTIQRLSDQIGPGRIGPAVGIPFNDHSRSAAARGLEPRAQ
jgi:hypothetical protein